jgi:hypothetical protein
MFGEFLEPCFGGEFLVSFINTGFQPGADGGQMRPSRFNGLTEDGAVSRGKPVETVLLIAVSMTPG